MPGVDCPAITAIRWAVTPEKINMGTANTDKSIAPRKLDLLGKGEASSMPKWNCVDKRLERMPPKAPAIPKKAGKRIRIASTWIYE